MLKPVVGFISDNDPNDRRPWSGTKNKLYEQVKACASEVVWVKVTYDWQTVIARGLLLIMAKLFGKKYSSVHTRCVARRLSASIRPEDLDRVDVLFAPSGGQYLYGLKTTKPIIYLTDATFRSIYNYYPLFDNFFGFNITQGNEIEQVALHKSWRIIASSDWCRDSVVKDYGVDPEIVRVIEFGANVDNKDIVREKHREENTLRLLFLGVEWARKGGDVAVDCLSELRRMGVNAELYVVGLHVPPAYQGIEGVHSIGFLNKNIPEQYNRFISIVRQADLLLLPTKAECSAIAFCEAGAYSLPVFTYDTGGIPNYVENGVSGYRLPLSAKGKDFAVKINDVLKRGEFDALAAGGRLLYERKLNWLTWQERFKSLLNEL